MEQKKAKGIDWIALAIVCFLNVHYFYILGKTFKIPIAAGGVGFLTGFVCFIFANLKGAYKSERKFPIMLFSNIIIFPVFTIIWYNYTQMSLLRLFTFSVFPMLLFLYDFNPKKVIDYTCYFAPLTLFIQKALFEISGNFDQMHMGYSNAVAHLSIACMFELAYYRKENKNKIYMNFCIASGLFLMLRLLIQSTRGTFLTLVVAFMVVQITNFDENGNLRKQVSKKVILALVALIIIYNFSAIFNIVERQFEVMGVSLPSAFQKTIDAIASDDLDHGRNELSIFTREHIIQRPIFGYGTQMFDYYNREFSYPHNCILQLLFENGIVGSAYIILNLLVGMASTLLPRDSVGKDELLARQLIMFTSLPMLLYSDEMWIYPAFWMFLMFSYKVKKRRHTA